MSAVDQWKKLARKTEIELHLEKDLHQSNRAQDCQTIEHLHRRLFHFLFANMLLAFFFVKLSFMKRSAKNSYSRLFGIPGTLLF